jgi:hypothetical protein
MSDLQQDPRTPRILYACQRCGEEVGEGEQSNGRCPFCNCPALDPIGECEEDTSPTASAEDK